MAAILPRELLISIETVMKAVRIAEFGGPEVLAYGDYPMPELCEADVLVKVKATSVSGWDLKYRNGTLLNSAAKKGLPGRKMFPMPQQLGREASGVVVAVGKYVKDFQVDDRVLGLVHPENPGCDNAIRGRGNLSTGVDYPGHTMFGGNAQYVSRPENYWVKLPDTVDFEQAAAGSWSFPTAHRIIIDRCRVEKGDAVLITGMSGGMGNASLQWAKLSGAKVIGTTRDDQKIAQLQAMGADLVVSSADLEQAGEMIRSFTHGRGVDRYIEFTGNHDLIALSKEVLAPGGTICLVAGDTSNDHVPFTVLDFTRLEMQLVGIRGSRRVDQEVYLEQLAQGEISVPVAREMGLDEIQEAHKLMEGGSLTGKIVLRPWGNL